MQYNKKSNITWEKMKDNMQMLQHNIGCTLVTVSIIQYTCMQWATTHSIYSLGETVLGSKPYQKQSPNNHRLWLAPLCRSAGAELCVHTVLYNSPWCHTEAGRDQQCLDHTGSSMQSSICSGWADPATGDRMPACQSSDQWRTTAVLTYSP